MPTYALLGATGQVGSSIYASLAQDPNTTIHIFVRSEKRLALILPEAHKNPNVKIFIGDISDIETLTSCIAPPVTVVFSCVAVPYNIPNTTIAQDSAHAIIASLINLRLASPTAPLPKILVLSSASLNAHLTRHLPRLALALLLRADSFVYADLARAHTYYSLHRSWMVAVFVQPGGLTHDLQRGHAVSLDREKTFMSYLDLGAGMVEIAQAEGEYDWKGVSVVPTSTEVKMNADPPITLMKGLAWHYMPWTYWVGRWMGIV